MEGSKRTITCIGHLSFYKKQAKKQKRYHLVKDSLLSNNTSNCFHYDSNPWENLCPSSQKRNNNSTFTKTKDCRQHALVTCAK